MKVAIADVAPVGTNVGGEVTVASINMDGFAFQALSGKNLYKNLVKAIVRELTTNGIDSHIEAGKADQPIFAHLPTEEEPWFAVRDEGIGLDDNGVRKVFLTFFGSTKRDNNELIGAYGLGSKSPLGYSDNFTVTAIKDGVKRMFVVFKNEDGCPSIKMLAEMPTTECNGVEVKVPVIDRWDYSEFHTAAADVYQWFPVKPILNVELAYPESNVWVKNIVDGVDLTHNSKRFVVHGMIAYPLDMHMLNKLDQGVRDIFAHCGLVIHAENGTVEYSMSREELSYKEGTVDYLSNKLTNLANALKSRFIAEMDGMTNWDRFLYVEQIAGRYREIRAQIITEGHSPLQVAPFNAETSAHTFYKGTQVFPKSLRTSGRGNVKVGTFDHSSITPKAGYSLLINDQGLSDALLTKKLKHNYDIDELKELLDPILMSIINKENITEPRPFYDLSILNLPAQDYDLLNHFRNEMEQTVDIGGIYHDCKTDMLGTLTKCDLQVFKLASCLHLLDGGCYEPEIKQCHVISAINIIRDIFMSYRGLMEGQAIAGDKAAYEKIIDHLSKQSKPRTKVEVMQNLKGRSPFTMSGAYKYIGTIIDEMIDHDLLSEIIDKQTGITCLVVN